MTTRVEWMPASEVEVEVFAPGEDWIGAEDQEPDAHVLTLSLNEVTAIEGSTEDLIALAQRIRRAVTAMLTSHDESANQSDGEG